MKCRCGHGRGTHYRGRGKVHLPCHAIIQVEKPGWRSADGSMAVATRMVMAVCKCRDFVA